MPHREKPLTTAPAPRIASANQGPGVFGFPYPSHRHPPGPARPGRWLQPGLAGPSERQASELTGVHPELTGVHFKLTGVHSELTGVPSSELTGVPSSELTGVLSSELTGVLGPELTGTRLTRPVNPSGTRTHDLGIMAPLIHPCHQTGNASPLSPAVTVTDHSLCHSSKPLVLPRVVGVLPEMLAIPPSGPVSQARSREISPKE
eukprot:1117226-Amphidinium_carterae.1